LSAFSDCHFEPVDYIS